MCYHWTKLAEGQMVRGLSENFGCLLTRCYLRDIEALSYERKQCKQRTDYSENEYSDTSYSGSMPLSDSAENCRKCHITAKQMTEKPWSNFQGEFENDEELMKTLGLPVSFYDSRFEPKVRKIDKTSPEYLEKWLDNRLKDSEEETGDCDGREDNFTSEQDQIYAGWLEYWTAQGPNLVLESWSVVQKSEELGLDHEKSNCPTPEVPNSAQDFTTLRQPDILPDPKAPTPSFIPLHLTPPPDEISDIKKWRKHCANQYWYYYIWYMDWIKECKLGSGDHGTPEEGLDPQSGRTINPKSEDTHGDVDIKLNSLCISDSMQSCNASGKTQSKNGEKSKNENVQSNKNSAPLSENRTCTKNGLTSDGNSGGPPEDDRPGEKLKSNHEEDLEEVPNLEEAVPEMTNNAGTINTQTAVTYMQIASTEVSESNAVSRAKVFLEQANNSASTDKGSSENFADSPSSCATKGAVTK